MQPLTEQTAEDTSRRIQPPRRFARAVLDFSDRHSRAVLIAMLLLLHFAALRGTTDVWARALLLAHLGLVLLWQPLVIIFYLNPLVL